MEITKQELPQIFREEAFSSIKDIISYWKVQMNLDYSCHIFVLNNVNSLIINNMWDVVSARIATEFQSQLDSEIEMYNIYLIFLTTEHISKEIKYKIEQDKYSCRKLVEDRITTVEFSEVFISSLIKRKIFSIDTLEIHLDEVPLVSHKSIESLIKNCDPLIFEALNGYQSHNQISSFYKKFKISTSDEK